MVASEGIANGSTQPSDERGRFLETAAAELGRYVGKQPDEIYDDLVSEVRTLDQSARVKNFFVILAIKNVKERMLQAQGLSPLRESSSKSEGSTRSEAYFLGDRLRR